MVLVFVVVGFVAAAYVLQEQWQIYVLEQKATAVDELFRLQIDKDVGIMHAAIDGMANDSALADAMDRGDRDALLRRVRPFFHHLRDEQRIIRFSFIRPDRSILLRVNEPGFGGDIAAGHTLAAPMVNGQRTFGLELGSAGTLILRTTMPWRDAQGRLLGFIQMGEDISHMAEDMHRIVNIDLLFLVSKSALERAAWQEPDNAPAGGERASFATSVAVIKTIGTVPSALAAVIDGERDSPRKVVVDTRSGRRLVYVAFLPLFDGADQRIGDIALLRDVTALHSDFRHSIALIAALSILAGVAVFLLFNAVLNGVERTYRRKHEIETQFLRLSSEHERIIQIEKLSEVGKTIGEIAHQLNNPLVGVINMAQLAERSVEDAARTRSLLAEIRKAGEDCRTFVRRMLEFTRISRSERRPVDLRLLVDETVSLFKQSAQPPPVTINMPDRPVILDLDPILLRHALFNLLANAARASPPDAPIVVTLHEDACGGREGWLLSVLDRGPGIAENLMDKIFVPFFSTRPEGTGLGLPVAQHIAILHGGRIVAGNHPEGGACFGLWLPATRERTVAV